MKDIRRRSSESSIESKRRLDDDSRSRESRKSVERPADPRAARDDTGNAASFENISKHQRDVLMRLQQRVDTRPDISQDGVSSIEGEAGGRTPICDEESQSQATPLEDESDDDQPLTDVLKRLQQEIKKEAPITSPREPDSAAGSSAPIDLVKMISNITSNSSQQTNVVDQPADYWKQLLSIAGVAPATTTPAPALPQKVDPRLSRDPRQTIVPSGGHTPPRPSENIILPIFPTLEVTPVIESKDGDAPYVLRVIEASVVKYEEMVYLTELNFKLKSDPRLEKHVGKKIKKESIVDTPQSPPSQASYPPAMVAPPAPPLKQPLLPLPTLPPINQPPHLTQQDPRNKPDPRLQRVDPRSQPAVSMAHNQNVDPRMGPQGGGDLRHQGYMVPRQPMEPQYPNRMAMPGTNDPRRLATFPGPRSTDARQANRMTDPRQQQGMHDSRNNSYQDSRQTGFGQPMSAFDQISGYAQNDPRQKPDPRTRADPRTREDPRKRDPRAKTEPPPIEKVEAAPIEEIVAELPKTNKSMTYSSPLSVYDDSPVKTEDSYQRRPNVRIKKKTPAPTPAAPESATTEVKTELTDQSRADDQASTALPPPPALLSHPVDSYASDDKPLSEVFKTKDPTASPFC